MCVVKWLIFVINEVIHIIKKLEKGRYDSHSIEIIIFADRKLLQNQVYTDQNDL